jgi:hypothetical protein
VLERASGKSTKWPLSHTPLGFYCYEYPKPIQEKRKQFGAKVFYYRSQALQTPVKLETKLYTDYAWIGR